MKIQTFSIVVGGKKCNASCPYCVSKMTGLDEDRECVSFNIRNFHKACQFARQSGVSTVFLTGKGEPLLYPELITQYLEILKRYQFPFIELQTNGIALPLISNSMHKYLKVWYDLGLTTISLSCAHWLTKYNKRIFGDNYGKGEYNLSDYIEICHSNKFSVRVSCVMAKGYIDDIDRVKEFIEKCRENEVEQFTIRPVARPDNSEIAEIAEWVSLHSVFETDQKEIQDYFRDNAYLLLELAHGAKVYDYKGQNISVNSCLTHSPNPDDIRQLIFFADGHLRYSWTHKGAIII